MDIKLSGRLSAIASMVKGGGTLCDVGCDHAHIPIYLLQNGLVNDVLAMDVIPGPLEKAAENLERYGCTDKVILRQSDGLDAYVPGEAQSLMISGMGGKIMRKILLREPEKTKSFEELILQPQADFHLVRQAIRELGFIIDDEIILKDKGKYYFVIHAVPGSETETSPDTDDMLTEIGDYYGPVLLRRKDPVLYKYLLWQNVIKRRIVNTLDYADTCCQRGQDAIASAAHQMKIAEEALAYCGRTEN